MYRKNAKNQTEQDIKLEEKWKYRCETCNYQSNTPFDYIDFCPFGIRPKYVAYCSISCKEVNETTANKAHRERIYMKIWEEYKQAALAQARVCEVNEEEPWVAEAWGCTGVGDTPLQAMQAMVWALFEQSGKAYYKEKVG